MTIFFLTTFLLINFLYINIWKKILDKVPTGVGILIIIPFSYYFNENLSFIHLALIFIFSLIYYLDDLIEIHFAWRILLQILAALTVYFFWKVDINFMLISLTIVIFFVLINTLNFQDGEDLNVSMLLITIFSIFYFYSEDSLIQNTSRAILLFLISFSFFNCKKKNLYFGDSSCYLISIIILIFVYHEMNNATLIKLLIAVIIFPVLDIFYVVITRAQRNENLLSRNYLHLYQIIAQKVNFKIYLLPGILFSILNIFISSHFYLGINLIVFLITLNIILLLIIRLLINKLSN